jgi:AbrB family looped-hinge helix DNA binding protein
MPVTAEYVASVKNKGQVTIPVQVRRKLDLHTGDRIVFRVTDTAVELEPARMTLEDTFASVTPRERLEDFAALRDAAIEDHVLQVVEEMQK